MAYFKIHGDQSGRVLDASMTSVGEVALWDDNGQDNQLWYWDAINRDVLRNKQFPNRVCDVMKKPNMKIKKCFGPFS